MFRSGISFRYAADMAESAPPLVETARLRLRRPERSDADAIFRRYASDADVTRYLAWPRHATLHDSMRFVEFSAHEWAVWPAGPYVIERAEDGGLIGGTGLTFEAEHIVSTGYVLARDAWGHGYASEVLQAMVGIATALALPDLTAVCHPDNTASARVLEKGGFSAVPRARHVLVFPNLTPSWPVVCPVYRRMLARQD